MTTKRNMSLRSAGLVLNQTPNRHFVRIKNNVHVSHSLQQYKHVMLHTFSHSQCCSNSSMSVLGDKSATKRITNPQLQIMHKHILDRLSHFTGSIVAV